MVGILNTQAGDRFIFSGSAINTPAVADANTILNGNGTQAGLKQVIAERAQADGTTGLGRLVISTPTTTDGARDDDVVFGRRRCRRFAIRPEAEFGVVVADRRDGERSVRFAGRGVVQLRLDQSQSGRSGDAQLQSAGRHDIVA